MLRKLSSIAFLTVAVALAGCSSKPSVTKSQASKNRFGESLAGFEGKGSAYFKGKGAVPRGGGKFHVGKPYQVAGMWFTPKAQPGYDRKGASSWYGEAFHRRKTSNGEYFDMNMLTAAHPTLPLPSYAKVTNLANGKTIVVRINDRGPFVGTRIIDLSKRSAEVLDFKHKGKANVRVQWIGNAPLNDQGSHLAMMNRKVQSGVSMGTLIAAADGPARGGNDDVQVASAEVDASYQEATFEPPKRMKTERANGPLYKVQMGPFSSSVGAEEALSAVQAEGYHKALLESTRIEQVAHNY